MIMTTEFTFNNSYAILGLFYFTQNTQNKGNNKKETSLKY